VGLRLIEVEIHRCVRYSVGNGGERTVDERERELEEERFRDSDDVDDRGQGGEVERDRGEREGF